MLLVGIRKNSAEFSAEFKEVFPYMLSHLQGGIKRHRPRTFKTFTVHAPSPVGNLQFSTHVSPRHIVQVRH